MGGFINANQQMTRAQTLGTDPPDATTTATTAGEIDLPTAAASLFMPGQLDQQDAILLWTGINSLLFVALVYLEVRD